MKYLDYFTAILICITVVVIAWATVGIQLHNNANRDYNINTEELDTVEVVNGWVVPADTPQFTK